jgi:predicted Fe-S protein YdhL (DUF1289 family)
MNTPERPDFRRAQLRQPGVAVPSPCINVCQLDERALMCTGCRRTLAEIGAWSRLSDAEKLAVWAQLEHRDVPV